jgi:aminoglycoside phosphotransferase (APT) family kinase protein
MIAAALQRFRLKPDRPPAHLESSSGAGVHAVRTSGGDAAYLKLTPTALGSDALAAARRELRFYRQLAVRVPVRTPRLLDASDDEDGVMLLLAATGTTAPAELWTVDMWTTLGRDLAALHDMADPAEPAWIRPDHLRAALAEPDLVAVERFWGATLPRLGDLISARGDLANAMDALPAVFVHGDCHTGNIAVTGESLSFLDWQMAGSGRPGTDLAFLNVRAAPAGVTSPAELTAAYLRHRDVDRRLLELALLAEELAVYIFQWPPYAAYNAPAGVERVRARASRLTTRWFHQARRQPPVVPPRG